METKRRKKQNVPSDSVIWVLVQFIEDGLLSEPIKLQDIEEEETGEDGLSKNLPEGSFCLAPYQGQMYSAKILKKSSEKEMILKEKTVLEKTVLTSDKNPNEAGSDVVLHVPEGSTSKPQKAKGNGKEVKKKGKQEVKKKAKDNCVKQKESSEKQKEHENSVKQKKKELLEEEKKKKAAEAETAQHVAKMLFGNNACQVSQYPSTQAFPNQQPNVPNMPSVSAACQVNSTNQYPSTPTFPNQQPNIPNMPSVSTAYQVNSTNQYPSTTTFPNQQPNIPNMPSVSTACQVNSTTGNQYPSTPTFPNQQPNIPNMPSVSTACQVNSTTGNQYPSTPTFPNQQPNIPNMPSVSTACQVNSTNQYPSTPIFPNQLPNIPNMPPVPPIYVNPSQYPSIPTSPFQQPNISSMLTSSCTLNTLPDPDANVAPFINMQSPNISYQTQDQNLNNNMLDGFEPENETPIVESNMGIGQAISLSLDVDKDPSPSQPAHQKTNLDKDILIRDLQIEIRDLKQQLAEAQNRIKMCGAGTSPKGKHYYPKTRPRMEFAEHYVTDPGNPVIREGFQILATGASIVVNKQWFISALASAQQYKKKDAGGKKRKISTSCSVIKHLMDGFFDYEDLCVAGGTAGFADHPVYQSLQLYAQQQLNMTTTEFKDAWNSKMSSSRKLNKRRSESAAEQC